MNRLAKTSLVLASACAAVALTVSVIAPQAFAQVSDTPVTSGVNSARGDQQPTDLFGNAGVFSTISNVLLFIVGAIAVIMIVIGGLRYVISGGDANQVQAAKNTILYALIGVIVAILAYAVVNFVVGNFVPSGSSGLNGSGGVTSTR